LEQKLRPLCKKVVEQIDSLILIPKGGNIVPLVLSLTHHKVSYVMHFTDEPYRQKIESF
jgi:hypothetical protein